MPNRILFYLLGALAAILVAVPFCGMFGFMGVTWMTDAGLTMGTAVAGAIWFVMGILIVLALVTILVEDTTHA